MSTWISVARYQLTDRYVFVLAPWLILAIDFLIEVVVVADWPGRHGQAAYAGPVGHLRRPHRHRGAGHRPAAAVRAGPRREPALLLRRNRAARRRLAAVYGLGLTVLQLIERATGGWGLNLHFFRVPYLLAGPWYLSWLTSFAGLALMFAWGMWFGIVYRRWNLAGLLGFIAVQALALAAVLLIIGVARDWPASATSSPR